MRLAMILLTITGLCLAGEKPSETPASTEWQTVEGDFAGAREAGILVYSKAAGCFLLIGGTMPENEAFVRAFDPAARKWNDFSKEPPKDASISAYGAYASDPEGKHVYCIGGGALWTFDVEAKNWQKTEAPVLNGWHACVAAFDPLHGELIVGGIQAAGGDPRWMSFATYRSDGGAWKVLELGSEEQRKAHAERAASFDALQSLAGRVRHAWYRDPKGAGSDAERKALEAEAAKLASSPGMAGVVEVFKGLPALIGEGQLLEALKAARAAARLLEDQAEASAPTPPARQYAPLVCDPERKVLVLFGGDREDFTRNDTWLFDLQKRIWRRAKCEFAPAPRAGHGFVYLPRSKRLCLFDGYRLTSNRSYSSFQAGRLPQREIWFFDAAKETWNLSKAWPAESALPYDPGVGGMSFLGYGAQYAAVAMASDAQDRLVYVGGSKSIQWQQPGKSWNKRLYNGTWTLETNGLPAEIKFEATEANRPHTREDRTAEFIASFCEVADAGTPVDPAALQPNTWTLLAKPPRNPHNGRRRRPYGTATWDNDAQELLFWGGGHKSMSSSDVAHWSPVSGRMVIGYDTDEAYGVNGVGGCSLLGRPFVGTHAYKTYAYDPQCKLMVLIHDQTMLYDPERMDWLPDRIAQPFSGHCYTTITGSSPHGVLAWAGSLSGYMGGKSRGLWRFDREQGWQELIKLGGCPDTEVDRSGMAYDSKRDRMLLLTRANNNPTLAAYDFKSGKLEKLAPEGMDLLPTNVREFVYLDHCDRAMVLYSHAKDGKPHSVVYDCANNRWSLIDTGPLTGNTFNAPQRAMVYDPTRKLVYVTDDVGTLYALKLEPK